MYARNQKIIQHQKANHLRLCKNLALNVFKKKQPKVSAAAYGVLRIIDELIRVFKQEFTLEIILALKIIQISCCQRSDNRTCPLYAQIWSRWKETQPWVLDRAHRQGAPLLPTERLPLPTGRQNWFSAYMAKPPF